jgi:hypothetical protein
MRMDELPPVSLTSPSLPEESYRGDTARLLFRGMVARPKPSCDSHQKCQYRQP